MTAACLEYCQLGAKSPRELVWVLESRRESAMVSIDILVSTMFPGMTSRSYKNWIYKTKSNPREDKRELLERAIKALDVCLNESLLPKTRRTIYAEGNRVTAYKRSVLREAVAKLKVTEDV